jgi:glycosyltransferase involved in cell wall biosynthesis
VTRAADGALPVVWYGQVGDPSGYAEECRALLVALERAETPLVLREQTWISCDRDWGAAPLPLPPDQERAVERARRRRAPDGPLVTVSHGTPDERTRPTGPGVNALRTMFETEGVPDVLVGAAARFDGVWVPSEANAVGFVGAGVPAERVRVLPETLDFELFAAGCAPLERPSSWPDRSFTFLSVFDFTARKGWDLLLDAWAEAFAPGDDVCLVLKVLALLAPAGEAEARLQAKIAERPGAPVHMAPELLAPALMPRLYAACDAFVLPSRGEAWGRPYMEALALGLPTIGPRWGGALEFMHDGNSWLVDGELVPVEDRAAAERPLYRGQRWFEPDRKHLVDALRAVADAGAAAADRAAGARDELVERFGPEATSRRVRGVAEAALAGEPVR